MIRCLIEWVWTERTELDAFNGAILCLFGDAVIGLTATGFEGAKH